MFLYRLGQTGMVMVAASCAGVLLASFFVLDVAADADGMDATFRRQAEEDAASAPTPAPSGPYPPPPPLP